MPFNDRWIPLGQFVEDEWLDPDDLIRLADAKRLPPHAWLGEMCLVDRSRLFSWRQLLRLEGVVLPVARDTERTEAPRAEATA